MTEVWTKGLGSGFFDDVDALVEAVGGVAGRASVYVSVNPAAPSVLKASWAPHNELRRARHRLSARYVSRVTALLIDIDAHTPGRDHARKVGGIEASATPSEREAVLRVARSLIDREKLVCTLFCSGNGAQILVPLDCPTYGGEDLSQWQARLSIYLGELKAGHPDLVGDGNAYGAKLDSTADSVRLMALAGTLKRKGRPTGPRPHSMVRIVETFGAPDTNLDANLKLRLLDYGHARVRAHLKRSPVPSGIKKPWLAVEDPFTCEMWNRFFREGPEAPNARRSGAIFTLALKLVADGLHLEDQDEAVQILWKFDEAHFQKFSERQDAEGEYLQVLDAAGRHGALDCNAVKKAFFGDKAKLCRECAWSGPMPRGLLLAEKPAAQADDENVPPLRAVVDLSRPMPLAEAREVIRDDIHRYLFAYCRLAPEGDAAPPVLLVKGPPGLGKSTAVRELLGSTASVVGDIKAKATLRATILAPYGAQLDEMAQLFRLVDEPVRQGERRGPRAAVKLIRGKYGSGLCTQEKRIKAVRQNNYGPWEGRLACRRCPDRGDCAYLRQFSGRAHSWLMAMHYAITGRMAEGHDNNPDVIVADEGILALAVGEPMQFSAVDLRKTANLLDECVGKGRSLAQASRLLADYVQNNDESEWGRTWRSELQRVLPKLRGLMVRGFKDGEVVDFLRSVPEKVEPHLVPKNTLPLLESLLQDLVDGPPSGYVSVVKDRLVVRRPNQFQFGQRPMIILDSTGDASLYRRILGREVDVCDPKVELECKVYQLARRYSKTSLKQERELGLALELVEAISKRCKGQLAVICVKDIEQQVQRRLGGKAKLVRHYYALRGSNEIQEAGCTDIVLLGTANPNMDDLAERAQALDREVHSPALQLEVRPYEDRDENEEHVAVEIPMCWDEALNPWLFQAREAEMAQAAFRLRPLDGPASKTIWVLSAVPLPNLPPTRVFEARQELLDFVEAGGR